MNIPEFNTKVYPLKDKIFRLAKRMLEQSEDAEDIVQEVFIRLWKKKEELDQYRSVEALAMITAKNLCLDRIKARKPMLESWEDQKRFLENLARPPQTDHSEIIQSVKEAMKVLPEQSRLIVHLRDIEGYEMEEIAEITGIQENTVRVTLSRARKRIRELMIKTGHYEYQRN